MINRVNRNKCCGCAACVQVCPVGCIHMQEDDEGFLFPRLDSTRCIKCNKCVRVCPAMVVLPTQKPTACYAYRSKDIEVLENTSSGGFFTAAARKALKRGGVVFGASFNDKNEVGHCFIESEEKLDLLRRSKYVQSRIGEAFVKCRQILDQGRVVLFCGTPCQIKALKLFLPQKYDNLIAVDFVCHGVPSPGVFRRYLADLADAKEMELSALHDINFRDKGAGFSYPFSFSYSFSSSFFMENPAENIFLKGFLADIYLRRSCYNCPAKGHSSGADYTICDFWGVEKRLPSFRVDNIPGVSQVFVKNDALGLFDGPLEDADVMPLDLRQWWVEPLWLKRSVSYTTRRKRFFNGYKLNVPLSRLVLQCLEPTLLDKVKTYIRRLQIIAARMVGVI